MTYKMTLKQRKWLKLYLDNGNATESAMQVYNCKSRLSAKQIGYENLSKLDFADFLEEGGVTDKLLRDKIIEGLNSDKIGLEDMTPDMPTRHKYLETALKLKRKLKDTGDVNINEAKILVVPSELIKKYEISSNTSNSSK